MNDNVISFEDAQNDAIAIERSEEFVAIASKISAHLNALPLDSEQHNRLVELICDQVKEAELTAFRQGLDVGITIGKHYEELKEDSL